MISKMLPIYVVFAAMPQVSGIDGLGINLGTLALAAIAVIFLLDRVGMLKKWNPPNGAAVPPELLSKLKTLDLSIKDLTREVHDMNLMLAEMKGGMG